MWERVAVGKFFRLVFNARVVVLVRREGSRAKGAVVVAGRYTGRSDTRSFFYYFRYKNVHSVQA